VLKQPSARFAASLTATLAVASMSAAAGCGTGSSDTPGQVADRLSQIVDPTGRPVYYLGDRFGDWSLTDVSNESGRIYLIYGSCLALFDSCAPPLAVMNEVLDPTSWGLVVGCSRLPPVRGVPAVNLGDALVLLTESSLITVAPADGDIAMAVGAADELRPVGGELSADALPPPDTAALQVVDAACGKNPGDAGAPMPDALGPEPAPDMRVPDFTVGRLGGGDLRWAAYVGKPVAVVVGDVPHVLRGIRRVRDLSATPAPVVIGLIWNLSGPAPIAAIERETGDVSVPVGYAAFPQPAVWFFDTAEIDPAEAGVIAFVNAEGVLIGHVRTDADDDAIRDALALLAR
jgi:hypothetical protein